MDPVIIFTVRRIILLYWICTEKDNEKELKHVLLMPKFENCFCLHKTVKRRTIYSIKIRCEAAGQKTVHISRAQYFANAKQNAKQKHGSIEGEAHESCG